MRNVLVCFLLIILSFQARAEVTSTELFSIINDRLSYMKDVALFKAQNHRPIEDIDREKIVIDNAKMSAHKRGLDPVHVEDFYKAQISVAKAIQYRYRADLLSQSSFQKPKDLQKEVRPALLRLGDQIIQKMMMYIEIYGSFKSTKFDEFDAAITVKYVTASDKQLIFNALQKIKPMPKKVI